MFLGLEDPWPEFVSGSALRLAAVGALGSVSTSVGDVQQWLLAGRAEGCPVRWGRPTLSVAPCLAFELGATGVSAEGTALPGDTGPWVAAGAGLRGALRLMPKLLLEAQAEAQLPLYRNDVYAGQEAVYRAESLAFQGGLGLSMRLW